MLSSADRPQNIHQLIFGNSKNPGVPENEPLVIDAADTSRFYTFADLRAKVHAFASTLLGPSFSLQQGDVVAIFSPNDIDYFAAFHGVLAAGCTACPLRTVLTASEIKYLFSICEPKLAIVHPDTVDVMRDALALYGKQLPLLVMATKHAPPGTQLFSEFLHSSSNDVSLPPLPYVSPDASAYLTSTSGTTGTPKLIRITHRVEINRVLDVSDVDADAVAGDKHTVLSCGHFANGTGLFYSLETWLYNRARQYVQETLDVSLLLRLFSDHRCTTASMLPPNLLVQIAQRYAIEGQAITGDFDLSSLQLLRTGGQPLDPKIRKAVSEALGGAVRVEILFGATECGIIFGPTMSDTYRRYKGRRTHDDSQYLLKIVDDDGNEVSPGSQGELLYKSPSNFTDYYKEPKKTADSIDTNGYYRTGDIFLVDDQGGLTFVGRRSDRIKTQFKAIVPKPIEDICMAYGGIKECAVVGAFSNKHAFELPCAFIVPQQYSADEAESLADAVCNYVNERVPEKAMELIGGVKVLPELPRTPTGKIHRFQLRATAQNEIE